MINTFKMTAVVLGLSLAGSALTCSIDGKGGFVPENNLKIPTGVKSANMTEEDFNRVIDSVETIYAPVISSMGAKLEVVRNWKDGTVNAYAQQQGKTWKVSMFGGLARHNTVSEDGLALVVCHEIGHHIGGAPKKGGSVSGGGWWGGGSTGATSWASNEGQSDYFATTKCLRHVFLNDNNAAIIAKMNVPSMVTEQCQKATRGNKDDAAICVRASMAGKSVSDLFSSLSKTPETKFDKPDSKVVSSTNDSHPAAQCRLDTYFQGAICEVSMNETISQTDEVKGFCHGSLGHKSGLRPLCWFKPSKK